MQRWLGPLLVFGTIAMVLLGAFAAMAQTPPPQPGAPMPRPETDLLVVPRPVSLPCYQADRLRAAMAAAGEQRLFTGRELAGGRPTELWLDLATGKYSLVSIEPDGLACLRGSGLADNGQPPAAKPPAARP